MVCALTSSLWLLFLYIFSILCCIRLSIHVFYLMMKNVFKLNSLLLKSVISEILFTKKSKPWSAPVRLLTLYLLELYYHSYQSAYNLFLSVMLHIIIIIIYTRLFNHCSVSLATFSKSEKRWASSCVSGHFLFWSGDSAVSIVSCALTIWKLKKGNYRKNEIANLQPAWIKQIF